MGFWSTLGDVLMAIGSGTNPSQNQNTDVPSNVIRDMTVQIQIQDGFNWRTVQTIMDGNASVVNFALQSVSRMHPNYRVRAIDANGRIVDML